MIQAETGPPIMELMGPASMNNAVGAASRAGGYQKLRYRMTPGAKPASNTPSRKRRTRKLVVSWTKSIALDVRPHRSMIRTRVLRVPILARIRLLGTSNRT